MWDQHLYLPIGAGPSGRRVRFGSMPCVVYENWVVLLDRGIASKVLNLHLDSSSRGFLVAKILDSVLWNAQCLV